MFTCTVGGKTVRLADLDAGIFGKIEKDTGVEWFDLFRAPIKNVDAGCLLLQKCAEHLEVDVPNPITVQVLVDAFELERDDTETDGTGASGPDPSVPGDGA